MNKKVGIMEGRKRKEEKDRGKEESERETGRKEPLTLYMCFTGHCAPAWKLPEHCWLPGVCGYYLAVCGYYLAVCGCYLECLDVT